jgi:hypothetical protein
MEFHLRVPKILKNWKSEIRPAATCSRFARSGPVCAGQGGREAGGETTRETENLAAWGGDSGRGPARGEGDSRASGGRGGRISGFQIFRKRALRFSGQGSLNDPQRTPRISKFSSGSRHTADPQFYQIIVLPIPSF